MLVNPGGFSSVKCVGQLSDSTIIKAAGTDCAEDEYFTPIITFRLQKDGAIHAEGNEGLPEPPFPESSVSPYSMAEL